MTNTFFYSPHGFVLAALAVLSATAVNAQQNAQQAAPQRQNVSTGAVQIATAPIALSAEQFAALQSQWKAGRNQFSVARKGSAAQFGANELGTNDFGVNSRVKTPETLASSLPPLEALDAPLAGDGSPVVAIHNRDERGYRDYDDRNDNDNDRYSNRRSNDWYRGNGNTIVLYLGQRFVDPLGRIIILGNNNTIIINQPSAYPTYGYPAYSYPGYGYNTGYPYGYGNPYGYGFDTSYGSLSTGVASVYTYNNGTNYPQSGYNSNYGDNPNYGNVYGGWNYHGGTSGYSYGNSYSNGSYSTRSNTTTSGWMNAPGTISSTNFPAYPNVYPGAIYPTPPQTIFQSNNANIRRTTPADNTPMRSYSDDNVDVRSVRR